MPETRYQAWSGLCLALGLGGLYAWYGGRQALLVWHAALWSVHPWQLWTASLAHMTTAHLLINLASLLALAILGAFMHAGRTAVVACLLAWPLSTLGLVLWPEISYYSGLSGLLMAMLAVLAVHATTSSEIRVSGVVLLCVLGFKLLTEHAWSQAMAFDPRWGFNVVYAAHLTGAVAGAASAAALQIVQILRRRQGS
ncbi:MAG: rhomboid family intramembrane serine protease [Burkholderiaceae bacterium]